MASINRDYTLDSAQKRAIFQRRLRRGSVYAIALLLSLWILIPVWLIGTMAFSTQQDVRSYPRTNDKADPRIGAP